MSRSPQLLRIATVSVLAVSTLGAFSGSPAHAAGPETEQVNVTGPLTKAAAIRPRAGSAKYLAYLVQPTDHAAVLKVRGVHGKTVDYGVSRDHTFALAGQMLTGSPRFTRSEFLTRSIGWWNLKTHKTGRLAIPKNQEYLGAAPDGVLLSSANGTVTRMSLAGKVTHLGKLRRAPDRVRTSDYGFVVEVHNRFRYQKWGHPGSFTRLQTGGAADCGGMSATYVACDRRRLAVLVRLSGGPPAATSNGPTSSATVGGDSVVYAEGTEPGHYVLASIGAGEPAPQHSSTSVRHFYPGVTAYGLAVFAGTDKSLLGATDATHVTTLVQPVPR